MKKIIPIVIVIVILFGGVAAFSCLHTKLKNPQQSIQDEIEIDEKKTEVKLGEWQEDYARILLELLYLPVANFSLSEGWEELEGLGANLDRLFFCASKETLRFALQDVNGDDIPELFLNPEGEESYYYYMFTTGGNISDCFLGRISYVNTDTKEIIRRGNIGSVGDYHAIYQYDGKELIEKSVFSQEYRDSETPAYIYEWYPEGSKEPAQSLTKEEYDRLEAKYDKADEFPMELKELTWKNISNELNISIPEQDRKLLKCLREVCLSLGEGNGSSWEDGVLKSSIQIREIDFNGDDIPDYEYTPFSFDYAYGLIVSSGDSYYAYEFLQGTYSSYHSYVEGEGILFREGSSNPGQFVEVYEMDKNHEFVNTYSIIEVYQRDEMGELILDSEGYGKSHMELHRDNQITILSSEECSKLLRELDKEETFAEQEYVMVSDLLYRIQISLKEAN